MGNEKSNAAALAADRGVFGHLFRVRSDNRRFLCNAGNCGIFDRFV